MKWTLNIAFEINRGREKIFSLRKLIPVLKRWRREYKDRCRGCFAKTRYHNEQHAMNAEWFKKRPGIYHSAYLCDVCDGWHITTRENK